MLPLHLQGWNSGSSGLPSLRQMRQVCVESELGSLGVVEVASEVLVAVREGASKAGSFIMSGLGEEGSFSRASVR
jgi:hypothetical protein